MSRRTGVLWALGWVSWLMFSGACGEAGRPAERPQARGRSEPSLYRITVGGAALRVEVATTAEEQRRGLSGRREVPAGTGMLFLYPDEAQRTFWMKDTPVPLTVAFLDSRGRIAQMEDMVPLSEEPHTSRAPARYVLEVPRGWFGQAGVEVGDRVEFGEDLGRRFPGLTAGGASGDRGERR